jgi:hypothetical protein
MKTKRILLLIGVVLGISLFASQVSIANHQRPRPRPPVTTLTAPTLLSPANGAVVAPNPTLSWTPVNGAVRYHIQIDSRTWFDQQYNFIEYWGLTSTSYTIAGHPEAYFPHLYWRVQAIDANNVAGPWSEVREFTITKQ